MTPSAAPAIVSTLRSRADAIDRYPSLAVEHAECAMDELGAMVRDARRMSRRYVVAVTVDGREDRYQALGIGSAMALVAAHHDESGFPVRVESDGVVVFAA